MVFTTLLTQKLGITVPVVQGGMQWVGIPQMAAAVSNAGGLGILTALTQPTPDDLRKAIQQTRKLTDKPFGVNITMLPTIVPPDHAAYARAAVEEGVRIFETAGSNPAHIVKYLKDNGCIVLHKCTAIRHAQSAAQMGVDFLSIDGFECAGHPGEDDIPGIVLLARSANELKIPYIASGGFADGRGLAAALALGAQGINIATRFMATVEAPIHQNVKETMVKATERDTVLIFRTLHNTARVFKNSVSLEVVAIENRGNAKFEDVQHLVTGVRGRRVYETGDVNAGIWFVSMVLGLINDIPTCQELLDRIVSEAEATIDRISALRAPKSRL
ncbi:hypothetical protein BS47DRAFT_1386522 [Hydnum rufescens UP504]|uniref:Nitronate monooxygenase n=1 Tax=Hydnum rufescens UP504 TaxID=1448309 RepID=A0A9P6ACX7_9AGAM|nr:hypothetical protein BS47DRAFT_1386522 [Hydnum rufescens UP504]